MKGLDCNSVCVEEREHVNVDEWERERGGGCEDRQRTLFRGTRDKLTSGCIYNATGYIPYAWHHSLFHFLPAAHSCACCSVVESIFHIRVESKRKDRAEADSLSSDMLLLVWVAREASFFSSAYIVSSITFVSDNHEQEKGLCCFHPVLASRHKQPAIVM